MSWLDKSLWLSVSVLFLTYAVFGWSVSKEVEYWAESILNLGKNIDWLLEKQLVIYFLYVFYLFFIILVSLSLTFFIGLITFIFKESVDSDFKAFISVFVWSFILVFLFCFLDYFADLLVMISSVILVKLDLQKMGYQTWQTFFVIVLVTCFSFILGVVSFEMKGSLYV